MRTLTLPRGAVRIWSDPDRLARAVADEFQQLADQAIEARGRFVVALAGGSTPRAVNHCLAADESSGRHKLPWERIFVFFGDERHVLPDHVDSNYRMTRETLLSRVPIPESNVHRIPAELHAVTAAEQYERALRQFFNLPAGEWPRFDLVLLGLGPDGHAASLFPKTDGLRESARLVCANWIPAAHNYRITLTFPVFNAAAAVRFVVAGKEKSIVLKRVLQQTEPNLRYPASAIAPTNGTLAWLVDEAAASRLG